MATTNTSIPDTTGIRQLEPEVSGSSRINIGEEERVWSTAGGALLVTYGLKKASLSGLVLAAAGSYLAYRGMSGYCPLSSRLGRNTATEDTTKVEPIEISTQLTIYKPREEVYKYWRQLENLPRFMSHLKEVRQLDSTHSHWVARITDGAVAKAVGTVEWDAQIINEVANERLVWKSVEGARIDNAGEVRFSDSADGFGTEIHATIRYRPPVGHIGNAIMRLFNPAFAQMIENDLRRYKEIMETDENKATPAQPLGQSDEQQPLSKSVSGSAQL